MSKHTPEPPNLPLDPRLLRRRIGRRYRPEQDVLPRPMLTRLLLLTDPELIGMAYAVNQGLVAGDSVMQIARRVNIGQADSNLVTTFLRAAGVDAIVKRRGGYAVYHARKIAESAELGRSAYNCRRGPARRSVAEIIDDMELDDDVNEYIRGQGAL